MTTLPTQVLSTLQVNDDQVVVSSKAIADNFGKSHKDVLKAISKTECSDDFRERNFALSFYEVKTGNNAVRQYKQYLITKDGFAFLAMGFTGRKAAQFKEAYITAFNQMAETLANGMHRINQANPFLTQQPLRFPENYQSGWLPALHKRCMMESHWTYHIRFFVRVIGNRYIADFETGVGGKGQVTPQFTAQGEVFLGSGLHLEYRNLDELWENIAMVLRRYNAACPFQ